METACVWVNSSVKVAIDQRASRSPGRELDASTVARASRGEAVACSRFVQFYQRAVFAAVGRILGPDRQDAVQDIAQETFVRALGALPRFDQNGAARLSTWLLKIATRRALTELRRRRNDPLPLDGSMAAAEESGLECMHMRRELVHAIADLTPEQRAAFVLRDFHGLTEIEAAEVLQLDVAAVRSRLFRARARLRRVLTEENKT